MDNNKYRPNTSVITYIISVLTCINMRLYCASSSGGPDREIAGNGNIAPCSVVIPRSPALERIICSKEENIERLTKQIIELYKQIDELLITQDYKIQSLDKGSTQTIQKLNNTLIELEGYRVLNKKQQDTLQVTKQKIANERRQVENEKGKVKTDIGCQIQIASKKIMQLNEKIKGDQKAKIDAIKKVNALACTPATGTQKRECKLTDKDSELEKIKKTLDEEIEQLTRQVNELDEKLEKTKKTLDDEIEQLTRQVNELDEKIKQLKLDEINEIQSLDKRTTEIIEELTNEIDTVTYIVRLINDSEIEELINEMETIANDSEIEELNNQLKTIEELNNQLKTIEELLEIIANDSEIEELNNQLKTIEELLDGQERSILIASKKQVIEEKIVAKKQMIEEKIVAKKQVIEEKIVAKKQVIEEKIARKKEVIDRTIARKKEETEKEIIVTETRKGEEEKEEVRKRTKFKIKMTNKKLKQLEQQIEGKKKDKIDTIKAEISLQQEIAQQLQVMQLMRERLNSMRPNK